MNTMTEGDSTPAFNDQYHYQKELIPLDFGRPDVLRY